MYKQPKKRKILCVFAHGKLKNARLPHAAKSEMQDLTRPSTHAQPTTYKSWDGPPSNQGFLSGKSIMVLRGDLFTTSLGLV